MPGRLFGWNDLRDEVGHNHGIYDNPVDLTAKSWTVMRFAEHQDEGGRLQWLIRKDGCMHCADPGCLKACPSPGAIIQYANGVVDFPVRAVHRLRLLRHRLSVQRAADQQGR